MSKTKATAPVTGSCLYEQLYLATPEQKRQIEFPFALEKAKLTFKSSYVNAQVGRSSAEKELREARSNFDGINLNKIMAAKTELLKHENTMAFIQEEYQTLFGEPIS